MVSFLSTVPLALVLICLLARCSFFDRPGQKLWLAGVLGFLAFLLAATPNSFGAQEIAAQPTWLDVMVLCFLITGPLEEASKLLTLLLMIRFVDLEQEPLTFVACGLTVGLVFAGLENWHMVETGYSSAFIRTLILPMHPMLTGTAAAFICLGALRAKNKWCFRLLAFLIPTLIHGINNVSPVALTRSLFMPTSVFLSMAMVSTVTAIFLHSRLS